MLKLFRLLSLIEGASLVTLFCVAMPAKYYFGVVEDIWIVGMTHGILWFIYFLFSLVVSHMQKWSVAFWALVLASSITPFACFFLDRKLKDDMVLAEAQ